MKRLLTFATVVVLTAVAPGLLWAQNDPQIGTWKLDVGKSKYVGVQAPKYTTRTVEGQGSGAKVSIDAVAADGSRIAYSFTTSYDGKDSPISGVGAPNGGEDAVAVKRVNANTTTAIAKKAGKVVGTAKFVVSKDGKVMTVTAKGINAQGQPTNTTTVWEKQ